MDIIDRLVQICQPVLDLWENYSWKLLVFPILAILVYVLFMGNK